MMRLSNFMNAFQKLALVFLLAVALPFGAKSEVGITIVTSPTNPQPGDMVRADFLVYNFDEMVSMQFSLHWDPAQISYVNPSNFELSGLTAANFGTGQAPNGTIHISWIDVTTSGVSMAGCSRIFSLNFLALGQQISPITIDDVPIQIEFINVSESFLPFQQNLGCNNLGHITGNIFNDLNDDCLLTAGEVGLEDWVISFEQNGILNYVSSDANGNYSAYVLPGDYDLSLHLPQNNLWAMCQYGIPVVVAENQTVTTNFAAQAIVDCPQLTVDIAAPFLRRCFESTYHVNYCNDGTLPAADAYVELVLDPDLSFVTSSIPLASQNGQTLLFDIGDVAMGQCGSFSVQVMVSCEAVLGQTHCTEAHIFPDNLCEIESQLWDGSILNVAGSCNGDSVHFTIQNNGDDMLTPVGFIVIEDDMVNFEGSPIQLAAGESYVFTVPANGSTWRLELDGAVFNPFNDSPGLSVEGCGVNANGSFSLGFVTQFPQGAENPYIDLDCQQNVDSYDPNDKTGYPNGYCAAHYIEPNQDIEYQLRFQNTGTAPAINVVILDTLPPLLNAASVLPGASSHPYDFELLGNGVVKFTFNDIMLPDSNANEAASHGFVNFTVSQFVDNPNGTVLANQAAIYFDFNEPVFTNTYVHTVATEFLQSASGGGILTVSGTVQTWYGEPVEGAEMTFTPTCPTYTDENGYYISPGLNAGEVTIIPRLQNGDKKDGVTVLDMLVLRKHIVGSQPLNSLLRIIAADANMSNSVTTFDIVEMGKMAIGLGNVGSGSDYWRFFTADSVFTLPQPPFSGATPSNVINFDNLTESLDSVNFFAVKPGNVIVESMVDSSELKPNFYFKANPSVDGQIAVEVKANDFNHVQGFQFGLTWDKTILTYSSIAPGALDNFDFVNSSNVGELQLLLTAIPAASLPDGTVLFTIVFDAIGPIGTSSLLVLNETIVPFQVVVEDCRLVGADFENATINITSL
ncbi:MAG: hypothetical protein IT258_17665, partial [Saprospiraceae bacterium]|nr:hypothetical protein [Saprospiraceae bacterium]